MRKLFQRHTVVRHSLASSDLRQVFLDLDLAILGAPSEEYDEYARQIRQEYCHYNWQDYRTGRKAVLKRLLARDRLYATDHFSQLYEYQARRNIEREIESLK